MDGAIGAGGLLITEGTLVQPPAGIGQELAALAAQLVPPAVAIPAEDPNHGFQGFTLPFDPGADFLHGGTI
jgi:hypothetical protein